MSKHLDTNSEQILKLVSDAGNKKPGHLPKEHRAEFGKKLIEDLGLHIQQLNSLRTPTKDRVGVDMSLAEYMRDRMDFAIAENGSPAAFFEAIGLNPATTTIHSLVSTPEFDSTYRWLVPEIIREAVKLGINKAPLWKSLIVAEQSVNQPKVTMPWVNQSAATPAKLGEAESIPVGSVSFGQKTVDTFKIGTGIEITDEVRTFVPLNLLSLYLGDVGVRMNLALDGTAIDVLINGDQADGSEASGTIGTANATSISYLDMLRAWIRMGRIGRMPDSLIAGEATAIDLLQLAEFKGFNGQSTTQKIQLQTPVPATQKLFVSGAMPNANYLMLVDTSAALIKLNSMPMKVESLRNPKNQVESWYVTEMTGFANMFRDARLIIQKNVAYAGFPAFMDVDAYELANSNFN